MADYFEDEDVLLKNSPLNQYLTSINLSNLDDNENVLNPVKKDIKYFTPMSILSEKIITFQSYINQKLLGDQILSLLDDIKNVNILNVTDEMYLQYLIETKCVHWNSICTFKTPSNVIKPIMSLILFLFLIILIFGKLTLFYILISSIIACPLILCVYGIFMKWLLGSFFQKLVAISSNSRQIILLLQELLSLNQGFSRLVHLKDNSNYDCSYSFNEEFLENFSQQIVTTLSDLFAYMNTFNNDFLKTTQNHFLSIKEIPWFQDEYLNIYPYDDDKINIKQPIAHLKNLHNSIQSEFSEFLKMIILILYSPQNHPNFYLPFYVIGASHEFANSLQQLRRYRKILQLKTKQNVSHNSKIKSPKTVINQQLMPICNSIRTLELHLFEISEFSSQFSNCINRKPNESRSETLEWLKCQEPLIHKSKKHIDSVTVCWNTFSDEIQTLLQENCEKDLTMKINTQEQKRKTKKEANEAKVVIDDYPEIVDEVIEGIPDESENGMNNNYPNILLDPYEERYTNNAKALLNEMKSVIEVRAKDWKKREKLALKRRAAEGKFVFNEDHLKDDTSSNELQCRTNKTNPVQSNGLDIAITNMKEFDFDFRRSLGEMVLKQRQNMLVDSSFIGEEEECFGD